MKKLVSYVFPMLNEEGNVDLLYKTITKLIAPVKKYDFELIFVNDGSSDSTLDKLVAIHQKDPRVKVISLSRRFGHQVAVTAGLDHANGDASIIMDSDMQDPPRVSLELIKKWEEGYDVVYAQRRTRKDGFFKKLTAKWFYMMLQKLANISIPRDTGDFRLMDRKVVEALGQCREHNRFLRGMVSFLGFNQTAVLFDRDERHAGATNYQMKYMLKLAADGLLGFSSTPLKLISRVGYFISALSFLGILYAIYMKIFQPDVTVEGWTFMVIAVLLIGGIQMIMLGVVGSYIGRIYVEAQDRPLYFVAALYEKPKGK